MIDPAFDDLLDHALSRGEFGCRSCSAAETQAFLIQFNNHVADLIGQHGAEAVGEAIWYLYGCVGDWGRDALDPSAADGYDPFFGSLETLYENGFAAHCEDARGHSDRGTSLDTACYMLWDMDSGLECLTLRDRPDLFEHGGKLFAFGLAHRHAAVQESFLHGLGHLESSRPEYVREMIDRFLKRRDISPKMREYAERCRAGTIL